MAVIKYRVTLSEEEVEMLEALLRKGKSAARKQTRARILLKAAAGCVSFPMTAHSLNRCPKNGIHFSFAAMLCRPPLFGRYAPSSLRPTQHRKTSRLRIYRTNVALTAPLAALATKSIA